MGIFNDPKIHKTWYPELGFAKFGRDWRILDMENGGLSADGGSFSAIGPFYRSKAELLADLGSYADRNGYKAG